MSNRILRAANTGAAVALTLSVALCPASADAKETPKAKPAAAKPAKAEPAAAKSEPADPTKVERLGTWGYDLTGRDPAVAPGADFYKSANGKWDARTKIPADRSEFGAFEVLADVSRARVKSLIEAADKAGAAGTPVSQQVGTYFRAYMDEKGIEKRGTQPLEADLAPVKAAATRDALASLMGGSVKRFGSSFFGLYIAQHSKEPEHYVTYLGQAGLGLPDRDYYLTAQFADKKKAYQKYIAQQLTAIGWPKAAERAAEIVTMETEIALVSETRAEQRDPVKAWNPMTPAELEKLAPAFPWKLFLAAADLSNAKTIVVSEPATCTRIAEIFSLTPVETLQAWLAFTVVDQASSVLPKRFDDARFAFRGKVLSGQETQLPRWKRGVESVGGALGEGVGKLYVDTYFPPASKAKMEGLVHDLLTAMGARIDHLEWMSAPTKAKAKEKLSKFGVKIGYPNKWRDYSALVVKADDAFGNSERSAAFEWNFRASRLDKPVDRDEWGMPPQIVNAYYDPTMNEIVFPAAILQPPFFDPEADAAVNYGAIGGVIGHEITHGFDDQGRQYDAQGRLSDWWAPEDAQRFTVQTTRLGAQYSAYEPLPGAKVNGELTMGENIADLGGLLLALDAYHLSLGGKPAPTLDGVSGDQRVLLGWAQVWRDLYRDDALRQQIASDPHSPSMLRVNGVVRNIDTWYQVFDVKATDALFVAPAARVRIW